MGDEVVRRLITQFGADDRELKTAVGGLDKSFASLLGAIGPVGAAIGVVTGVVVGLGAAALELGSEFDKAFDSIRVATGATETELAGLNGSFKTIAAGVPEDFGRVSRAVGDLNTFLGLTGPALEKLATQELNLSRITGESLGPQVAATSKLFNNFHVATEDQSEALDFLFKVSQKTGIGVTKLSEEVTKGGAALRGFGFSFKDSVAIIGLFDKAGVDTEKVLAAMEKGLRSAAKAGEAPVDTFKRVATEIKSAATETEAINKANALFGRGSVAVVDALRNQQVSVEDFIKSIGDMKDGINETAAKTNDFGENLTVLGNKLKLMFEPVASAVFDAVNMIVAGLSHLVDEYTGDLSEIGTAVSEFVRAAKDAWQGHGSGLIAVTIETWRNINDQTRNFLGLLRDQVRLWGAVVAGDWDAALKNLEHILDTSLARMAQDWQDNFINLAFGAKLGARIQGALKDIGGFLAGGTPDLADSGMQAGTAMGQGVGTGFIDESLKQFRTWEAKAGPGVRAAGGGLGKAGGGAFGKGLKDETLSQVNEWLSRTKAGFAVSKDLFNELGVAARVSLTKQATAWKELNNEIEFGFAKQMAGLPSNVIPALQQILDKTKQVGVAIIAIPPAASQLREELPKAFITSADAVAKYLALIDAATKAQELNAKVVAADAAEIAKGGHVIDVTADNIAESFNRLKSRLPESWQAIVDAIVGGSGKAGAAAVKFGETVAGAMGDVLKIVGNMPGELGDSLRRTASEFERWYQTINGILGLLSKLFKGLPSSIDDALSKVIGIFKKTQTQTKSTLDQILDATGVFSDGTKQMHADADKDVGDGVSKAFGIATSAIGGFVTGLTVAQQTGSKAMGALSGALTGALSGAAYGPWGAAIGGAVGLIGGLLGGKSALQKAQEAAALQEAKDRIKLSMQSVLQAFEATKQSILDTVAKAKDILESIRFYDTIGKDSIKAFFGDLDKFMRRLVEESKIWLAAADPNIKAAAENLGAGVDLIAKVVGVLPLISGHFKVGEAQMDVALADSELFITKLGNMFVAIPNKIEKAVGKGAKRIGDGVALIRDLIGAIVDSVNVKEVPDVTFTIIENALDKIVQGIGNLGEKFAKGFQKTVGFFADQVGPAVSLWATAIDAIKAMVDIPRPSRAQFDAMFESFGLAIEGMITLAASLSSEGLTKANAVASAALAIFEAIKAAAEAFNALRDYVGIPSSVMDAVKQDFHGAVLFLADLLADALTYLDYALHFQDAVSRGSTALRAGMAEFKQTLGDMSTGLTAAEDAFTAAFGAGGGPSSMAYSPQVGGGGATTSVTTYVDQSVTIQDFRIGAESPLGMAAQEMADRFFRFGTTVFANRG
jgi:Phage-related minor tail protein